MSATEALGSRALIVFVLACLLSASAPARAAPAPRIVFETKVYDYDRVRQGQLIRFAFKFKNDGDAPLVIHRIDPSCVCTLAQAPKAPIPPGGSELIEVEFDSLDKYGYNTVFVRVFSNDETQQDAPGAEPVTILCLRGEIESAFEPGQPYINFDTLSINESLGRSGAITITRRGGFEVKEVLVQPKAGEVTWKAVADGVELSLRLTESLPLGRYRDSFVVATNDPKQPRLKVGLSAQVLPLYNGPAFVFVDPGSDEKSRIIPIERSSGSGLEIEGIDYDRERFKLSLRVVEEGRYAEVLLGIRPDAPAGAFASSIELRFRDPKQPRLSIPVLGMIAASLRASPDQLLAQAANDGQELGRVELSGAGWSAEAVLGAKVEGAPAKVEVLQERLRTVLIVRASAREGAKSVSLEEFSESAALIVETKIVGRERLVLPFRR